MAPLISTDLLKKADKILFIAHLALGDFTYMQSCFRALAKVYPHLKIHLWVDEQRRTDDAEQWEHLRKYSLYDWLAEFPNFDKVYSQTYSPALFEKSLNEARAQDYPIVVSLATLTRHKYASLARKISPHGFVVGQKKRVRFYDIQKALIYRKLNAVIPAYSVASHPDQHISDIYAEWFGSLFGLEIPPADRYPVLEIADKWKRYAHDQFASWGFVGPGGVRDKVVFLNSFSKSVERTWPLERVAELIRAMRAQPAWCHAGFVVNVIPEELPRARDLFDRLALDRTYLFSAEENFFQLPAILSLCDLIVSVETAVMHLANAVHVPVVALMRQKNPEWTPIDRANSTVITVPRRHDWVDAIGVEKVLETLKGERDGQKN